MLTIEQCRAARGLINWTQQDLADKTGISKTSINQFEKGHADPKGETRNIIQGAFEAAGIEFHGLYGVNKRTETVKIYKGPQASEDLWDDIFDSLKETGGEVLISSVNEKRVLEYNADGFKDHMQRMQRYNITERLLACEGDDTFIQPRECYRWIPKQVYHAIAPTFVYGDKVAIKLWDEQIIILIHSQAAAQAERKRFDFLWAQASVPPLKA